MPLLQLQDLETQIYTRWGTVKAVNKVSLTLEAGETLGLVGESGSGKSMTCLSIMGLPPWPNGRIVGGRILFKGLDLVQLDEQAMQTIRGKQIALIPQDPSTSLNPVYTVGNQVMEGPAVHQGIRGNRLRERAIELLRLVRIAAPEQRLRSYPHQMSGGMRQRVVGSIGMSCGPEIILADEPTTNLDVTIQAQYLQLLKELQARFGIAIIYVTHDLGLISRICDRLAVMYAGSIVEVGSVTEVFANPSHPYTQALLQSIPPIDHEVDRLPAIEGEIPRLHDLPPGCAFADRCSYVLPSCRHETPPAFTLQADHLSACWRHANGR
jgi:oligopeptide/dipeptide ABC transporter ATP-binding protein